MFRNYLTVAVRNLLKQKGYTFINVTGLAVGIACCILILLYVQHELSYDRFHEKADRIYRVAQEQRFGTVQQVAVQAGPVGPALAADFAEIETAARININQCVVRYGDRIFPKEKIVFTDSTIFDVFTFPLLQGNEAGALNQPGTMVLTESMAARYFDADDPIGEVLTVDGEPYTITGVMKDVPSNAHFDFAALATLSSLDLPHIDNWGTNSFWTYVVLAGGVSPDQVNARMQDLIIRHRGEETAKVISLYMQPLKDIHLHSDMVAEMGANGDIVVVYIFSAIAIFILLIACINYMNLATARSVTRMREVGVRKALGAYRLQLIWQFLSESFLLTFVAIITAVVLVEISLPVFNRFLGTNFSGNMLDNVTVMAGLFALFIIVGLLAGAYPAFSLSRFRPSAVLKGTLPLASAGALFRKGLVVLQFTISIVLIVAVAVSYQQLQYVHHKHLGFEREYLVNIDVRGGSQRGELLKREFLKQTGVTDATLSNPAFGSWLPQTSVVPEGAPRTEEILMSILRADPDIVETAGLQIAAGRNFSYEIASDSQSAAIINETAVQTLGFSSPEEAPGKQIGRDRPVTIVGVIRDFHFSSLHNKIEPVVILWSPRLLTDLTIRIRPENMPATLSSLEKTWAALVPDEPFLFTFVDERIDQLYKKDAVLGNVFGIFALIAVFVACLGLFGLASFTAQQRTKEIGIRKALGSSSSEIVLLLSKDFARLVLFAFVVASPIAYLVMKSWLENFAYHVSIGVGTFVFAGVTALFIAMATVSFQSIRASLVNPSRALRYE